MAEKDTVQIKIATLERLPDYNGTSKSSNKPFCRIEWNVSGTEQGIPFSGMSLRTLDEGNVSRVFVGAELEVENDIFGDNRRFFIPKAPRPATGRKSGGSGGYRPAPAPLCVEAMDGAVRLVCAQAVKVDDLLRSADKILKWLKDNA